MSDDEDETHCPLCVEEMDLSDKNFLPCPCGYRVCMWCWHHIRENLNGLCPACRTPYNADPHAFSAVDRQEIVRKNRERKQKEKLDKKTSDKPINSLASLRPQMSVVDRRHLHNYRVVQRNLVYVIGVPSALANEDLLRKPEYFGQYGKIGKVVIHKNISTTHATASAYVTFLYKDDAKASIQALDGFFLDGHVLRASFGTTKYCNNFIRGVPCSNPDCVYLHDLGDDDDRFTKEEIQAGHSKLDQKPGNHQTIVTGNGGPSGTGKKPTGESILPPPVFIQDIAPPLSAKPMISKISNWTLGIDNPQAMETTRIVPVENSKTPDEDFASKKTESPVEDRVDGEVGDSIVDHSHLAHSEAEPNHSTLEDFSSNRANSDTDNGDSLIDDRVFAFRGVATCCVFPVPVSSFAASIWSSVMNSEQVQSCNPYDQLGAPFSELLNTTLPPIDAVCLPRILSKSQPGNLHMNSDTVRTGSHAAKPQSGSEKSLSSILALRQIFPGVNMNVGAPSGTGRSS